MRLQGGWIELDEVGSTQEAAAELLRNGSDLAVVLAQSQTRGRGRHGREWLSERGDSLTMSLIFREYANHPRPYLVGMAAAIAAAGVSHSVLRWPNDLYLDDRKVGGVLTELIRDPTGGLIPVVGLGINLNQTGFPGPIADHATSLHLYHGGTYVPEAVAREVVDRLARLPEPTDWQALEPIWRLFDHTPGKRYRLVSGEEAVAIGIASDAQLLCQVNGETRIVPAAEAIFGTG